MTLADSLHHTSLWKVVVIAILVVILFSCPSAHAHRSGCYAWHSCPSDHGTYECDWPLQPVPGRCLLFDREA